MNSKLTPRVVALVEEDKNSGRFQNYGEVLSTAPRKLGEWKAMIQEGIDSADRGKLYTEEEARAYIAAVRARL